MFLLSDSSKTNLSIIDSGMLSTTSNPTSSRELIAVVRPAPDEPVIITNFLLDFLLKTNHFSKFIESIKPCFNIKKSASIFPLSGLK